MATPFETFVNTELPKRLATNVSPIAPTAGQVPVFTGVGLLTENKSLASAGIQADLANVITAGTYGNTTKYPVLTFNAKGICTGVTLQTVDKTLTETTFAVEKTGASAIKVTWILTALTAARAWTIPDKAINLGDLPSVATTNSNALSGTRCTITGGQLNTVSGIDNSVINSSNNTVSGTRNTVVGGGGSGAGNTVAGYDNILKNCRGVVISAGGTNNCVFNEVFNDYAAPELPVTLQPNLQEVTFNGWLNPLIWIVTWPRGCNIRSERTKLMSGAFGVSGARYLYKVNLSLNLAATSAAGAAYLESIGDSNLPPSAQQASLFGFGYAEHDIVIQAFDPVTSQFFSGRRRLRDNGTGTVLADVIGTDLTSGGFTPVLAYANVSASGYFAVRVSVRNSANSNNCFWTACIESSITHLQEQL